MGNDKVAGAIGKAESREQREIREKIEGYRARALVGDDAVFDAAHGIFLIHGKHKNLVGVETVIAVDLASMLLAISVVLQTTVVPILTGQLAIKPNTPNKPN